MMDKSLVTHGLVNAYLFDGQGHGKNLGWDDINQWRPEDGLLWINLDYAAKEAHDWIKDQSQLEPIIIGSLLAEHSSPRCFLTSEGVQLNLRGVNFTPDSETEDMVSIRIWINKNRIISIQRHHLFSIDKLIHHIEQGLGPCTAGEFIIDITTEILEKTSTIVGTLE